MRYRGLRALSKLRDWGKLTTHSLKLNSQPNLSQVNHQNPKLLFKKSERLITLSLRITAQVIFHFRCIISPKCWSKDEQGPWRLKTNFWVDCLGGRNLLWNLNSVQMANHYQYLTHRWRKSVNLYYQISGISQKWLLRTVQTKSVKSRYLMFIRSRIA